MIKWSRGALTRGVMWIALLISLVVVTRPAGECFTMKDPTGTGTPTPSDAATVLEVDDLDVTDDGLKSVDTKDITLKKNNITMMFAKRLAGAVWRMTYTDRKGKEHLVIPELAGNGGSLQVALAFDIPPGESPEIENPTEAGNHNDMFGKTTSKWLKAAASDSEVFTKSRMAYYYVPGEKVASSPKGSKARGDDPVSDVVLKKRVKIGWRYPNVVNFDMRLDWDDDSHWFMQMQLLAVYLARDFSKVYLVRNGKAKSHDPARSDELVGVSPPDTSYPVIVAKTKDVAIGLYAHTVPKWGRFKTTWQPWYSVNPTHEGAMDFGKGLQPVKLTAATAVWHAGDPEDKTRGGNTRLPTTMHFGMALVFGTVDEVASTIGKLSKDLE